MGKTITPKYALHLTFGSGGRSLTGWNSYGNDGRATDKNLAAWVAKFDASMAPGGSNAHLGPDWVTAAWIAFNTSGGSRVATYTAPSFAVVIDNGKGN